jgi:hypothetical protein
MDFSLYTICSATFLCLPFNNFLQRRLDGFKPLNFGSMFNVLPTALPPDFGDSYRMVDPVRVVEQLRHLLPLEHHLVRDPEIPNVFKIEATRQESVENIELVPIAPLGECHNLEKINFLAQKLFLKSFECSTKKWNDNLQN